MPTYLPKFNLKNLDKSGASNGYVVTWSDSLGTWTAAVPFTGVTSVALSMPSELSVAGSPITGSGTFTVTWASQSGNKFVASPADGTSGALTARAIARMDMASYVEANAGSVLRSPVNTAAGNTATTSATAYWLYIGYRPKGEVVKRVRGYVITGGSGSQTAEVAVATSTTAPTGSNITLTKLWADGTIDALTGTGRLGNSSDNSTGLSADAHVWIGIRTAMATTQPTFRALAYDFGDGYMASTAGASALTGSSSWTATPVGGASQVPDIRGYL